MLHDSFGVNLVSDEDDVLMWCGVVQCGESCSNCHCCMLRMNKVHERRGRGREGGRKGGGVLFACRLPVD